MHIRYKVLALSSPSINPFILFRTGLHRELSSEKHPLHDMTADHHHNTRLQPEAVIVNGIDTTTTTTTMAEPAEPKSAHQYATARSLASSEHSEEYENVEKPVSPTSDESERREANDEDLARQKSMAPSSAPSEIEYPHGVQLVFIMASILLSLFLMSLDRTIIATAIPQITDEFHSLDDIGWYGSAFMLTAACFQLLWGKVYTFYTPKYVFLFLVGLFEVGSAICGAAPNSIAFIIGRAIAGMGSAGIMSGAIVLMISAVPLAKRPMYNGFFGAVFGLSSVIGPLLGGAFTTDVSWRWCFYINLPIGGVAMLIILFILKPQPAAQPGLTIRQQLAQMDLLGEFFLFPSIICLLLALQWGGTTYAWSDWRLIILWLFFALCLVAFCLVEAFRQKTATIQAHVIKNRSILAGMWFVFCLSSTMLTVVYYLPIWFQAIKDKSAVDSGIATIPLVLSLVFGSIFSGQMVGRLGYYTPFAIASSVLMPIGAGLISTLTLTSSTGAWIGYQIILGFGIGIGMQQGALAAQTVLKRPDVPMGVSLMFFMQQLGGAIFVSVGQNVFNEKLIGGLISTIQGLDVQTIVGTGATDLRNIVPADQLHQVLLVYNNALKWVFLVGVITACLSVFGSVAMEWRTVKGKQGPTAKGSNAPSVEKKEKTVVEEKV